MCVVMYFFPGGTVKTGILLWSPELPGVKFSVH